MRKTRCFVCHRYTSGKLCCTRRHCQQIKREIRGRGSIRRTPAPLWVVFCRFDLSDPRQRAMLGLVIRPLASKTSTVEFEPALSKKDRVEIERLRADLENHRVDSQGT